MLPIWKKNDTFKRSWLFEKSAAEYFSLLTAILLIANIQMRKRVFFDNENAFKAFIRHVSIKEDSHTNLQR